MPHFCSSCGAQMPESATFCSACGKSASSIPLVAQGTAAAPAPAPVSVSAAPAAPAAAEAGTRALGFLIDIVPILVIGIILMFLPVFGWFLTPLVGLAYWLLRDIGGASPGKSLLGLRVAAKEGGEASQQQRVLRNVTLAAPQVVALIPLLGWMLAGPLSLIVLVVEIVMLFTKGERVGDQIAGTKVIRVK